MKHRYTFLVPLAGVLVLLASVLASSCNNTAENGATEDTDSTDVIIDPRADSIPPLGFWEEDFDVAFEEIRSGETFIGLMTRIGAESSAAYAMADASKGFFDVTKIRAGASVAAYYHTDSTGFHDLHYAVYDAGRKDLIVFQCADTVAAWRVDKPLDVQQKYADITINTSLWNDLNEAGASTLMIAELSDIYAWSVDFFGLQKGDRFRAIYQETSCDGEVISVDSVYYAIFNSASGKEVEAVLLDIGEGYSKYWQPDGQSLKKAFLKAPLKFTRISSGFTYHRKHPVTGKVKPHTAVDYAAPKGTPVMSIGDGTVLSAGWGGGGGNTIKIKHNATYTTAYLHLSKFANGIKAGKKVRQGDVIGYVGSTGVSTGPHLDFRVWKNGTPINPLTMDSPNTEPIATEYLPALDSIAGVYRERLAAAAAEAALKAPAADSTASADSAKVN